MKKIFFCLMAVAAAFTSCNNEDLTNVSEANAINFDGFVNKSTRSGDITNGNLDNFSVYGFMESAKGTILENETVTKENGVWTYDNTQYWTPGKSYFFSAIAPASDAQWSYDVNDNVNGGIITFTNGDGTQDLIYAHQGNLTYDYDGKKPSVSFNFTHLLSRVSFSFKNGFDNPNIFLNIKDVKITNAVNTASRNLSTTASGWRASSSNENITLNFGDSKNPRVPVYEDGETNHKFMIPVYQTYELEFTVEMYQGEELAATYTHTVSIEDITFNSNKSYNLTTTLNATNINPTEKLQEIEFSVSDVEGWYDGTKDQQ